MTTQFVSSGGPPTAFPPFTAMQPPACTASAAIGCTYTVECTCPVVNTGESCYLVFGTNIAPTDLSSQFVYYDQAIENSYSPTIGSATLISQMITCLPSCTYSLAGGDGPPAIVPTGSFGENILPNTGGAFNGISCASGPWAFQPIVTQREQFARRSVADIWQPTVQASVALFVEIIYFKCSKVKTRFS
jgi:hypothetical protein